MSRPAKYSSSPNATRNPAAPATRRNGTPRGTTSSRQGKSKRTSQPSYLPTRREIARRCREIQAAWTPATRRLRDLYRIDPLALTPIHVTFDDRVEDAA